MSVKILGGKFKGRSLEVPQSGTRPTSVMLRRRIFDAMQSLEGYDFVDLCAGSGSVGFEALSRGANSVTFVELGKKQVSLIQRNFEKITGHANSDYSVNVVRDSAIKWSKKNNKVISSKTIVFFDPPYAEADLYFSFFELLPSFSNECLFLIEVSNKTDFYSEIVSTLASFNPRIIKQGEREVFWF
jgi:16S rRNA (guanine966-N2)-methyltransferase